MNYFGSIKQFKKNWHTNKNKKKVMKTNDYSNSQIEEYGKYIELIELFTKIGKNEEIN